MKSRHFASQIALKDLPLEGQDFDFSRATGEMNLALKDLIGENDYKVHLHIAPMGNTFDVKGQIDTELSLQCSLCANDFRQKIHIPVNELLVIQKPLGKNEQSSKVNHAHEWATSGPDYMLLESDVFDVAEYTHEAIGLAEPIRPLCAPENPLGCQQPEHIDRPWLSYGDQGDRSEIRANPFQLLQKIKLKS